MADLTPDGKFAAGNKAGGTPPYQKSYHRLKKLILEATSEEQLLKIWGVVLIKAEEGDMRAVSLFFDRLLGPAADAGLQEQVEALEKRIMELQERRENANAIAAA